jgi:general L-amino acid transport system permease protein
MGSAMTAAPRAYLRRKLRDRDVRQAAGQVAVLLAFAGIGYVITVNAIANMARLGMQTGFGFLESVAGFDVTLKLIAYGQGSSYGRVLLVAVLNTLLAAFGGIVLATVLGFLLGIARLSTNWLLATMAGAYVEAVRNIPLLLFVLLCYHPLHDALPVVRNSLVVAGVVFLNNRGLSIPSPIAGDVFVAVPIALLLGALAARLLGRWAERRQAATGRTFPTLAASLGLTIGFPLLVFIGCALSVGWDVPQRGRFGISGGIVVLPELVAIVLALSIYTAGFIAEIVRAGILAVGVGQREAARALGLKPSLVLRLVILPQALRVVVPPLINQYANIVKNTSFGAIVAYPELVQVFMGTTLSQTGHAIEIAVITLAIYLGINLAVSLVMNRYNRRIALVTR